MYGHNEVNELFANSASSLRQAQAQFAETQQRRAFANNKEQKMFGNAAAVIPRDVYLEFDSVTKKIMRNDEGDTILNDLLGLSRAIDIGKIEYKYRRVSDSGNAVTTLSGQTAITMDKAAYSYDSAIVPVHQDGFGREWRELAGLRSEGFDALIDDQENSVRAVRRQMVDYILDGSGVTFNGITWSGLRNDSRVASVDLGGSGLNVDLTSGAVTAQTVRDTFKSLRDTLRITNNVSGQITFYVSREIMSNLERYYSDNDGGYGTMLDAVLALNGIAAVKESAKLVGNELFAMELSSSVIQPLVGMSVSTIPLDRPNPMDAYNFMTWGAMGIQVKTDYDGRTGVLYASEA
ncbi:MAG: major capsid protein [Marinomonas gallaica]